MTTRYNKGDTVSFYMNNGGKEYCINGIVKSVEAEGAFEQDDEPAYNIIAESPFTDGKCLFTNVRESFIIPKGV